MVDLFLGAQIFMRVVVFVVTVVVVVVVPSIFVRFVKFLEAILAGETPPIFFAKYSSCYFIQILTLVECWCKPWVHQLYYPISPYLCTI